MTETPAQPIDRKLQAEAALYEVPYKAYVNMSPRERAMAKAQWTRRLKVEARKRGLDPEEFVAMTEEERQNARAEHPERAEATPKKKKRVRPKPTTMDDVVAKHGVTERVAEDEMPAAEISTAGDKVPPTESDARRRNQMTIGPISVVEDEDLVGVAPPKTLQDIYARWPVGDGQHYLRVERVQPKVWEKIAVAGYLGEITTPISEEEFQRYFGGKEYLVTLYGPDPKGRRDPNTDDPIIKAKTEAIKVTVPMLPPNLRVLPAAKATKKEEVAAMGEINPFQTLFGGAGGVPATPAEATMHRTSMDFIEKVLKRGDEETRELRRELDKRGQMSGDVLRVIGDTNQKALDAATRASEAREKALTEALAEERRERRRLEEKLDAAVESRRGGDQGTLETLKLLNPSEAARDALNSAKERHADEVRHLRETHQTTLQALKESHTNELSRERDRYRDMEDHYRRKIDDIEKHAEKREKELKDEIDRVRRDERDVAAERVRETEKRFEDRIKDMKEQHDRELRMNEQHATTRLDTQKTTLDFQRLAAEERAAAARDEADRLRQEAEDAKDPIKVKEKAESLAEAFGFTKADENAPQTATERLASGVGMGLGKALEGIQEWLPRTMREVAEIRSGARPGLPPGVSPAQLPPGAHPQQGPQGPQGPQQRRPRSRAVAWASKADVPVEGAQPRVPNNDVGWQPTTPAQPSNGAGAPQAQAQPQAPPPAQPQPQPPPQQSAGAVNIELQNRFGAAGITAEYIQQFRAEVERAIETGFSSTVFAERFAQAYPEPSYRLATGFTPQDLFHVVEAMGGAESPVLRRDGKKWVESLWQALKEQHQTAPQPQVPANA